MNNNLLVLSDSLGFTAPLTANNITTSVCCSPSEVLKKCAVKKYDLIMIDLRKDSGYLLDVIRYLRKKTNIVIWLLTAELKPTNIIEFLQTGADNCFAKKTSKQELQVRIDAFFRRKNIAGGVAEINKLIIDELSLCLASRELKFMGENIQITAIEFELLQLLMSNINRVVSRGDIAENIFNRNLVYCSKSVNMHISNIRKKLNSLNHHEYIKTVRGNGYVFVSAA
ncbi:MAG: response regulator transcription factor [Thalassotalea sp.]